MADKYQLIEIEIYALIFFNLQPLKKTPHK